MGGWTLRLTRDALAPAAVLSLPPGNRVLYVREGEITVTHEGAHARVAPTAHGTAPVPAR